MEHKFKINAFSDLATLTDRMPSSANSQDQRAKHKPAGPRNAARVKSLSNENLDDLVDEVNQYLATKGVYSLSQPIFTSMTGGKTIFHAVLRFSGKIDQFAKDPWQLSTDYRFAEFYHEDGNRLSEEARRWDYILENYEGESLDELEIDFPITICRHHVKYGRYNDRKPTQQ